MLKWERIINDILLENSYDLTMFSSKDISSFSESCSKVKLIETTEFDEEYYENPSEFEAHKRAFIMAAEQLLCKNIDYSNIETDLKKLPKKNIYEFFKIMETGKLPLYAKWFNTLTKEQKQDLLNEMLHKFAESIESGGKLMLKESKILYNYYKKED